MESGSKLKWWLNSIAAFIFILLCIIYLLIRPIIVQNLEPVLTEKAGEKINGTLTWDMMDIDPNLDLSFTNLVLKDQNGEDVLKSPSLTIGWSSSALFNYLVSDGGVVDVVKDIHVDTPEVHLKENADGSWNVESLLKPSDDTDNGTFTGRLLIQNGEATIQLSDDSTYEFTGLGTTFSWDKDGKITGPFEGSVLDSHFDGNLNFTNTNQLEVNLKTDPVSLKSLQPLLNQFPQVSQKLEVNNGTGEVTSAKIWKSDGAVAYHVKGHINDAALRYENYILADGAAFFDIENGHASFSEVSLKINDQKFTGDGAIHFDMDDPILQGQVTLQDIDINKLMPEEAAAGVVSGTVSLSGTMNNPFISGELLVKNGQYQNLTIPQGAIRFSYGDNQISIPYLMADAMGGHVEGHGSYDMTSGGFEGNVSADHISLDEIPVDTPVGGIVSGHVIAKGSYTGGNLSLQYATGEGEGTNLSYDTFQGEKISGFGSYQNGRWQGCGYGMNVSYDGIHLSTLSGSAKGQGEELDVEYLTGTSGEGAFTLSGHYGNTMDLTGQISSMDLSMVSSLAGVDVGGKGSADFHVKGTMANPTGSAHVSARDGHIQNVHYDSIDGQVNFHDGKADVTSLTLKDPEGNHTIKGVVGLTAPHDLQLTVTSEKTRIEHLLSLANLDYPVTGWIENTMTIGGNLDVPTVSGDFQAWSGSIMGELFQSISGQYSYDKDGLTLKNGLAYIYGGTAAVNGKVTEQGIDMDVSLMDIDMDHMLPNRGIVGKVNMNGHAGGTMEKPTFDGTLSSREITIGGTSLYMISTGIHYVDHLVSLDEGSFRQQNGTFTWKGSYHTETGVVRGLLQFDGWNIKEALKLFKMPSSAVDGTVKGGMRIGGTLDAPNVDFKADLQSGHLGDTPLGEGHLDFSYMNGALAIRTFQIPVGSGLLAMEGNMNSAGDLDIQVAAKDMDISWIPQVMEKKDMKLGGHLTALVSLSGNKKEPNADVSVTLDHPSYGDISFDTLSLMANASHNVVTIQNALLAKDIYRASMKGTMPGNLFTGSTTDKAVPLDLDINLDQADMNILALFCKPVTSASGPIKGHVKVAGSYENPLLFGGVSVKEGQLSLMTMNEPIHPITLSLSLEGNRATFDSTAVFGGGQASAKGSVDWENKKISHYEGEAHIHTPSVKSTYFKGAIDGDFQCGEIFEKLGVSGNLSIHDAVIDVPFALFTGEESTAPDMLTKISVNIGDNVKLYNSSLYDLMIHGNVDMMGNLQDPILTGRVNVEKGTVRINMSEFKVDEARAIWGGEPGSFLPVVHVKANTKVGHYAIGAELDGPPGDMKTVFHSEPALNDSQIVMLLTLHADPTKDNSGAMEGALFNAGLTMIFGDSMKSFFQDTIGLDLISVTSSLTDYYSSLDDNQTGNYYIKIGKYLFNDFMLTATMGVNNDKKSMGFHYDFTSHAGLSSWYNSDDDSYVGTDWSFKF